MNWSVNKYATPNGAIGIMVVNHVVGIIGLNSSFHTAFENISWLNLLLSFAIVLTFHHKVDKWLLAFCVSSFIIGMAIEIVGVQAGQPFGQYYYTEKFGWQLLGVPFIIGLNWVLLGYVCGMVSQQLISNKWLAVLVAALGTALLDVLLEPFAIRHGFWVWQQGQPPLQNYLAWFAVSLLIQGDFTLLISKASNKMAWRYLLLLSVFLFADLCLGSHKHF